jgi:hypothetical protein
MSAPFVTVSEMRLLQPSPPALVARWEIADFYLANTVSPKLNSMEEPLPRGRPAANRCLVATRTRYARIGHAKVRSEQNETNDAGGVSASRSCLPGNHAEGLPAKGRTGQTASPDVVQRNPNQPSRNKIITTRPTIQMIRFTIVSLTCLGDYLYARPDCASVRYRTLGSWH